MPTGPFKVTAALNSRDRGEVSGVASAGDRLTNQDVLIEVPVGATVRGEVRLPDGGPAAGALVAIDGRGALSGPDGSFAIPGVAIRPLQPQTVEARSADGRRTGRASVVVGSPLVEGVVVVLSRLGSAEPTVLDAAGQPLVGQQVALLGNCFNPCGCLAADSGSDGRVRFDDLPLGSASFRATRVAPGFIDQVTATVPLTQEGVTVSGVLRFAGAGTVSGTVLGPDGEPSFGADVALTSKVFNADSCVLATTTGAGGSFRLERVPAGLATLTAEVVGGIDRGSLTAQVPGAGSVDVAIVLAGTGAIDGQTLDSSGLPVAGEVTLRGTGQFPYTLGLTTGPDGRLFLPEVLAGPVTATLRVTSGPFVLHGTASGVVAPGETNDLVVQVQPSGTVSGLVLRSDGTTPAFGAAVTLRLDPNRGAIGLQVGPDGRFAAAGVPLGPFTVEVSDPITTGVGLLRGLELVTNGETIDFGAVVLDGTPVEVESVTPADGAAGVPVNTAVVVTFSDPLKSAAGVSVFHGAGALPLARTLSADERTVTLTCVLPDSVEQTVVAGTDVTDVFGRHPAEVFTSRFRTVDLKPPAVAATVPGNGALEVDPAIVVAVAFDEALEPSSDVASLIAVNGPLGPVTGTAALASPDTVTFTPAVELGGDAVYFAGHWLDLASAGGVPKGVFRVAAVHGAALTLKSVDGGAVDVVEGDLWQSIYRFDSLTVTGGAILTSVDPILP